MRLVNFKYQKSYQVCSLWHVHLHWLVVGVLQEYPQPDLPLHVALALSLFSAGYIKFVEFGGLLFAPLNTVPLAVAVPATNGVVPIIGFAAPVFALTALYSCLNPTTERVRLFFVFIVSKLFLSTKFAFDPSLQQARLIPLLPPQHGVRLVPVSSSFANELEPAKRKTAKIIYFIFIPL
jgi:hypothetical protein